MASKRRTCSTRTRRRRRRKTTSGWAECCGADSNIIQTTAQATTPFLEESTCEGSGRPGRPAPTRGSGCRHPGMCRANCYRQTAKKKWVDTRPPYKFYLENCSFDDRC
ncbi:hypothetical protein AAG570_000190 [Ranatra chinensis]|uniref:Uncharacterized protein n=1 Tax=Ranatra chinensis TaxID=642074 RepID=A0ABD0ZHK3_9HEMI